MGLLTDPHILAEIYLARFPASLGTTTVRLTELKRPVSFAGAFFQPRLTDVGEIVRAATDPDGNYEVGGFRLTAYDSDGELAELLDQGEDTEYWYARELALWVISYEGKLAGLTPATTKPFARGWIRGVQRNGRSVTIDVGDVLGSQMSGFNLDKKVLQIAYKDVATVPREDTKDRKFRLAVGEFSDRGAKDKDGVVYANGIKALWPVFEVCEIDITDYASAPVPVFAAPPVITQQGVVGASGQKTYYYAASLITANGESGLSNVVACDGASVRSQSDYNWVAGTYDNGGTSPYNRVRIWRGETSDPNSFHLWLDEADYFLPEGSFGYSDGGKLVDVDAMPTGGTPSVSRDELDSEKELTPSQGTAQTNANIFSVMEICKGYGYTILDQFASDLADGTEPRRKLIEAAEHGVTTIWPTDPQWPFPDPWIEMNGVIFFGFLQRGPKLNHHRDGSVTMAVNFCGPNNINQAFPAMQFLLNEHCLKNKGTGYRNGTYSTLETYENGDPLLQTSTFTAAQALSMTFMGDAVGYLAALWVDDPEETWRDVVRDFCVTFGARLAPNRFGQIKTFMVDTTARTIVGRHFRERIEIKRTEESLMAYDQIVNQYIVSWFYDQDVGQYRGQKVVTPNLESIAAHVPGGVSGSPDKRGLRELEVERPFTSDEATCVDVTQRELLRRQRRPRYPVITVPMLGLDHDLGEEGRLTDSHGLGRYGDVATPVMIQRIATRLGEEEVTLTFQDLRTVSIGTSTLVGDESGTPTAVEVGDEESVPPTAVEVG